MKKIVILGVTGSIGTQALNVIRENRDKYEVTKVSIGKNVTLLREILVEFTSIKEVAVLDEKDINVLSAEFPYVKFEAQTKGILHLLDNNNYDLILNAIVGFAGVLPSIKAIELGKVLALANKETMVVAGALVKELLHKYPEAKILPVDSEHCAIFQCIGTNTKSDIKRLVISASGGSFRDLTLKELENVTVEEALNHPNWNMGKLITIDSATMLNKGLEVIEAHWLFDVDYDDIDVVIHRESIVHSMVEYNDSSMIAQLSLPNMEQPIAYAFAYPERAKFAKSSLDLSKQLGLTFSPVDFKRFKGLQLSYEAGRLGHSYPCVLNASKEVASQAFLDGKISFLMIVELVEKALNGHKIIENPSLKTLVQLDAATRKYVERLVLKEQNNDNT